MKIIAVVSYKFRFQRNITGKNTIIWAAPKPVGRKYIKPDYMGSAHACALKECTSRYDLEGHAPHLAGPNVSCWFNEGQG
ncbi:hypothetical protein V9K67_13115 [Paraflavisolibacter sp. H34]